MILGNQTLVSVLPRGSANARGRFRRWPVLGRPEGQRCGVLALELILVLPIMLIALLAIIQFGQYFANLQELSFASRIGAQEAAQTSGLPSVDGGPIPANIVSAIDYQLHAFGINHRMIVLEHNASGTAVSLTEPPSSPSPPKLAPPPPGKYVRVIVVVPKAETMPELLKVFGLTLAPAGKVTMASTVFAYER